MKIFLDFENDSDWKQHDNLANDAKSALGIYLIDFDELYQSKEYAGLSFEECF